VVGGVFRIVGVVCLIVVVILTRIRASHLITYIIVWPHIQLMHGTPVLLYSRGLPIIQRPSLWLPWGQAELGLLVAGVAWL